MQELRLRRKKGFYQLTLNELVKEAGGRDHLLSTGNTADDVADALFYAQEDLLDRLGAAHEEVGLVNTAEIWDYAGNCFPAESVERVVDQLVEQDVGHE